jgi:hypothetical protein
MIDWDSTDWGGGVTLAANGSWVADKHSQHGAVDTQNDEAA